VTIPPLGTGGNSGQGGNHDGNDGARAAAARSMPLEVMAAPSASHRNRRDHQQRRADRDWRNHTGTGGRTGTAERLESRDRSGGAGGLDGGITARQRPSQVDIVLQRSPRRSARPPRLAAYAMASTPSI